MAILLFACAKGGGGEVQPVVPQPEEKDDSCTLRVLFWNIQNGMWSDQADSYENFLAFVRRYDPDVCVWCDALTTIYWKRLRTRI